MNVYILSLIFSLIFSISLFSQPPGAIKAKPNIMYYAGGSCDFYDISNVKLLSVDKTEAI